MDSGSLKYKYHSAVAKKAVDIVSSIELPEGHGDLFRSAISCEFSPQTESLAFCWVFEKDKGLMWMTNSGVWVAFPCETSQELGKQVASRLDDIPEDGLGHELGFGMLTDLIIKSKARLRQFRAGGLAGVVH